MTAPDRPTVAIVGLGLIGGSLALRLIERGYDVRGFARDPRTREQAAAAGVSTFDDRDAMLHELRAHSVVVLAAPLPAVLAMLPEVASATDDSITVTDVVSVKVPLRDAARAAGIAHRFVGAHPMAGTAESGFAAAQAALLDDAKWVLTVDDDTDVARWHLLARLVLDTGGVVVPADSEWHDHAVAWISHLPHVLAELLASNVPVASLPGVLAAGSFRDGTRVAATRPELVDAMLLGNQRMLVEALESFLEQLEHAATDLKTGQVSDLTERGYTARTAWQQATDHTTARTEITVRLDQPDHHEQISDALRGIGERGGYVVSTDTGSVTALVCEPGSSAVPAPEPSTALHQQAVL